MNRIHTVLMAIAATITLASGALAADQTPKAPATYTATGVVKQVDAAGGKVVIDHEAIKSLYWPAMTMGFAVKDKALFDKLAVGKKVEFQLTKAGTDYVVIGVK